jgi:hypothetical protein
MKRTGGPIRAACLVKLDIFAHYVNDVKSGFYFIDIRIQLRKKYILIPPFTPLSYYITGKIAKYYKGTTNYESLTNIRIYE